MATVQVQDEWVTSIRNATKAPKLTEPETYHQTMGGFYDHYRYHKHDIERKGYALDLNHSPDPEGGLVLQPMAIGQYQQVSTVFVRQRGTRKSYRAITVAIYRLDSGNYEIISYAA